MTPVVVTTAAPAAGRASINGWFAANSWFFPFRFCRGMRKGRGHFEASMELSILSLRFGRIRKERDGSGL
jgi:hypothetical protein